MASRVEADGRFVFVGGLLCLDFVNTELMDGGQRVDRLTDFGALVDWCEAAGALDRWHAECNWRVSHTFHPPKRSSSYEKIRSRGFSGRFSSQSRAARSEAKVMVS